MPGEPRRCAQRGFGKSLLIGQGARATLWLWRVVLAGSTNTQEPPPDLGGATRPNNGETETGDGASFGHRHQRVCQRSGLGEIKVCPCGWLGRGFSLYGISRYDDDGYATIHWEEVMQKIQGGCLCGAIRYRSDAQPLMTAVCNCKNCQRQSGSALSVIVALPRGALIMEGAEPASYRDTGASGFAIIRRFCANCGSPILSEPERTPTKDWLKAGTLDDTSWLAPTANFWCDSEQPWLRTLGDVPRSARSPTA